MRQLAGPLLLACVLFLAPMDWSLWTDEFFSAAQAGRSLVDLTSVAAHDRHPPLYFYIVAFAGGIANTDWMLRLPSGIASVLAVGVTAVAARRLIGERAAAPAAWWLASSPLVFVFAHTARMYALCLLWGALLLLGSALAGAGRRSGLVILALAGTAALYTHYAAIVPVVAALLAALLGRVGAGATLGRRFLAGLPVAAVGLFVALAFLPWALGPLTEQLAGKNAVGIRSLWVETWLVFSPDEAFRPLTVVAATLLVAGAFALLARRGGFALAWLAVGTVGAWLLSENIPARLPRNYLGMLPFFALAGASVWAHPRVPRWLASALPVVLQGPVVWLVAQMPTHPQDVGGGHDYRIEAALLDTLIPADHRVRFQPAYVLGQFSRYAPGLAARTAGPTWTLKPSGKTTSPCALEHAFRVRVDPPEGSCPRVEEFLATAPETTTYPGLHYQRAVLRYHDGDRDGAIRDLDVAEVARPRHPGVAELRARVAADQGDDVAAEAGYRRALAIARAYDFPGKRLAGNWMQLARLARARGDEGTATAAVAAAECARTRSPAWACGGVFEPLTTPAAVDSGAD